jgi:single-stranded DNA-binding protein
VKCKLSFKREELIAWLQSKEGDWINADVKVSNGGKWYAAVDNWKPDRERQAPAQREEAPRRQQPAAQQAPMDDFADDDIPF